jgi:glycosyltransferase involved in cell wall biosynthesis
VSDNKAFVVDVIVVTYGSEAWRLRGEATAKAHDAHHFHAERYTSLGDARNQAIAHVDPQGFICIVDADDQLAPGYIEAMDYARLQRDDLGTPALQLGDEPARCLEDRDIIHGNNPCPVGTLIHRSMFEEAGRFWGEPAWEDWSLYRRAVLSGACVHFVPGAVYIANSTSNGRNSTVINPRRLRRDIVRSHLDWFKA